MSKFNPLSKRRPSSLSSSPSPSPPSNPISGLPSTDSTLKISSPLNPNPSPKSTSKSTTPRSTPKSNTTPLPPAPQIQATSSTSTDSSKGSENGGGGKSAGSGMIAGASNFFRKRARSFSNAARKEERGRAASAPDTAIAGLPSPDEVEDAGEGASAPDILLSQASSTSTIIPSAPLFKSRGVVQSHSNALTLTRTHSNTDTLTRSRSPFRTLSRTLSRSHSRSHSKDNNKNRGRSTSTSYRDNSPGSLDLDIKSLEKEKEKEQEEMETHHHAFGLPTGWWERTQFEVMPRPWKDGDVGGEEKIDGKDGKGKGREVGEPKRLGSLVIATLEQAEGWDVTRKRVAVAARSVIGTSLNITHQALVMGVDLLDLAPVPGLRVAALTLLNVWDALQKVDMNRMACLRLTQRCADILICVRQEVQDAGGDVGDELKEPIDKLVASFDMVYQFLQKQTERPFLKRYLKRDEILRQIAGCDASLSDSVSAFSLSIQIRILKQVQALNSRMISNSNFTTPGVPPPPAYTQTIPEESGPPTPTSSPNFPQSLPSNPDEIRARLHAYRTKENERDAGLDFVDLRQLMRAALQTNNDVQMIEVLQVGREEMPEAIKTLQRALEREREKENVSGGASFVLNNGATPFTGGANNKPQQLPMIAEGRRGSVPVTGMQETAALERRKTIASSESKESGGTVLSLSGSRSGSGSGSGSDGRPRDTLDREFIESGIDALRRVSHGPDTSLPSWTITKYEVDLDEKIGRIGIGYFSTVYKGTWRKRTVAIKVLATTTPRKVFTREIEIWKSLSHVNVLELFGASSAIGEPPWFFVSPYCQNGSLVTYLKGLKNGEEFDLLRCMHQVAKGMEYLHRKGVLHGDLKGANVLVDDNRRCLVSDFGQSEMRSEAYRLTGTPPAHGTLRWQAPEMMGGHHNRLTQEMDIYAFAICCVEILDKGTMPWQHHDDFAIVRFVTEENKRPTLPQTRFSSPTLTHLIHTCWERDPSSRPSFKHIASELKQLRIKTGSNVEEHESPRPPPLDLWEPMHTRPSPDMRPIPLPGASVTTDTGFPFGSTPSTDGSFQTAMSDSSLGKLPPLPRLKTSDSGEIRLPEPVLYTPSTNTSQASSIFDVSEASPSSALDEPHVDFDGYESPPPPNDRAADIRDERRYRLLLTHDFHPSLTLPLWTPGPISLGAVGYLEKPGGSFVTLFNSFSPGKSSDTTITTLPSLYGYGRITRGEQRQDKRGAARRGLDALAGLLTFKAYSQSVSRRYSFQLRDGHKSAFLCTETTKYRYVEDLDAPKKWFKANVESIMKVYGRRHHIQKEDLFLVIGTLDAPDHALFVSHKHPDGQVHFNVFGSPKPGQFWGTFTTDTEFPPELGGPSYHEEIPGNRMANCQSANKVSMVGGSNTWDTVLLARLRFKPDVSEPTSL
ncbi:hypothetical protein PILCRDRAFT_812439 [Piloderma croceum F 1598]|uniref:Protein kinase domain-containing protein n=1 Tax=Piloderma croceum (strain F 1598) TaxID=765440 RepID=A0A0C3G0B7_PILCF|nr:hypothetical protein PILCRDRAFT_812439 [Piloderma croceum F 1598]